MGLASLWRGASLVPARWALPHLPERAAMTALVTTICWPCHLGKHRDCRTEEMQVERNIYCDCPCRKQTTNEDAK